MKNKYIRGLFALVLVSGLVLGGCAGVSGKSTGDVSKKETATEDSKKDSKKVSEKSSSEEKETKEEEKSEEVNEDDKKSDSGDTSNEDPVEATQDASVEEGWIEASLYDLSYATPGYYNMIIDEISDHSERGSYYERAYDIGEGDSSSIGIHMYAYEKNAGISPETSYTDAKSRTEDHGDMTFETVDIPSLAATVYRAEKVNENSYLPYTYVYIFEKGGDDTYIYEIYWNDRFEESALRLAFEKTLSF